MQLEAPDFGIGRDRAMHHHHIGQKLHNLLVLLLLSEQQRMLFGAHSAHKHPHQNLQILLVRAREDGSLAYVGEGAACHSVFSGQYGIGYRKCVVHKVQRHLQRILLAELQLFVCHLRSDCERSSRIAAQLYSREVLSLPSLVNIQLCHNQIFSDCGTKVGI